MGIESVTPIYFKGRQAVVVTLRITQQKKDART
jgi:hypothetical protein